MMSAAPAVAAPDRRTEFGATDGRRALRHAREVHRCTMFGTSQAWDIPDALRGMPKNSAAFKAWYMTQYRATRKSLAARGNIQACKSIKKTKELSCRYMRRVRDHQRVMAQQIALGENADPWGACAALLRHEENLD